MLGPLAFLLLCGRCRGAPPRSAADLRMDCRWQPRLEEEPSKSPPARRSLKCVLCVSVCSALRERMASLSFCIFARVDGRTREGERGIVNLSRSALSGEAKFCTVGLRLLFCIVCVCVCVCVCVFLEKLYFSFHAQLSLLTPAFIFHAGVKERKMYVAFLDETKPNQTNQPTKQTNKKLCILFWMRPSQKIKKGTCISKYK